MRQFIPLIAIIIFIITVIIGIVIIVPSDFKTFQDNVIEYARNDKVIDQNEYESLINQIKESEDDEFRQFLNEDRSQIDNAKVSSYLFKFLKAKNISLSTSDIWQPESVIYSKSKFNINVFLENSASMDGYVKGVTEFETAIYNLLGDFKISDLCDSLNLNYILTTT